MSIRFYTDAHIPKQVVTQLRSHDIDVLRCQDVNLDDASDIEHLEYAVANKRALITKDDDFLSLHQQWDSENRTHFGIFYCPYRDTSAIGMIVTVCREYYELIAGGAGTLDDVKNSVIYIT